MMKNSSRRTFIAQLATAGTAAVVGFPLTSSAKKPSEKRDVTSYIIKNACILSMDPSIGELKNGDILVENDKIVAVRENITDHKATVIDGSGMIALPGFIETHWHIWTSLMRAMPVTAPDVDYFTMSIRLGKLYSPQNTYHSTRLAIAEAISSGITHIHDWSHNVISADHAEASLRAMKEAGIRARFSMGVASGQQNVDLHLLNQLKRNWDRHSNGGLMDLGLAWPGIENNRPAGRTEIETARKLNLPVSVHAGRRKDGSDSVDKIASMGLLAKDLQIVHGTDTTAKEYQDIAAANATISTSPFSEMKIGYGLPPAAEMLKSGAALGFSVDTTPLTGNADMFAVMKMFMNLANGMSRNEFQVTAKRVLEIATIEAARSMGLSNRTGSITPEKKADIQLVNTRDINIGVVTDPYDVLTLAAQPYNVDTVMVNGKILKRHGKLTYVDTNEVIEQAKLSLKDLMQRAK